jgi:hypothetical protein
MEKQAMYDRISEASGLKSIDLCDEIARLEREGLSYETARLAPPEGAAGVEMVEILYVPHADRAGVAWGSDAVWFDARGIDEAFAKFFTAADEE